MVVRIPGLAYQKGFGGHFHNDNSVGALRDIPGLVLAVPARGDDAVRMLRAACRDRASRTDESSSSSNRSRSITRRTSTRRATAGGSPTTRLRRRSCFPARSALYQPDGAAPEASVDLLMLSYANGLRLSLQAQRQLAEHGVRARVVDLRWLNPLPSEAIRADAAASSAVLVVDECRATGGGVADAVIADLVEHGFDRTLRSVRAVDSFVPLGTATAAVLVGVDQIVAAGLASVRRQPATEPAGA